MLQKCANPSCTAPFRSLREGKLFLAEIHAAGAGLLSNGGRLKEWRREHYWLCEACSSQFTLRFDAELGMVTVPLSHQLEPRFLVGRPEADS